MTFHRIGFITRNCEFVMQFMKKTENCVKKVTKNYLLNFFSLWEQASIICYIYAIIIIQFLSKDLKMTFPA